MTRTEAEGKYASPREAKLLLDLPHHKEWLLPDGQHKVVMAVNGSYLRMWVLCPNLDRRNEVGFTCGDGRRQQLVDTYLHLAEKGFRPRAQQEAEAYARSFRR